MGQWLSLGAIIGVLCGSSSALFLWLLDRATHFRIEHQSVVFALPVAGLVMGLVFERFGRAVLPGNNLVIDTIHDGGAKIPTRMAPMVLLGTVTTHLFGGSAGREGTAVQIGASLSDWVSHVVGVSPQMRRQLLAAGTAGGFASVFGTPLAGIVFGLEFMTLGRLELTALVPAVVAAFVGDWVTRQLGIIHTEYPAIASLALSPMVLIKWVVFSLAVGLVAMLFIELTHWLKKTSTTHLRRLPVRLFFGGALVVVLWQLSGTNDYLGLGVPTIVRALSDPSLASYSFAAKLVFTAVTLGAGFLGGEVTPLFFVGAALGNVLAQTLGLPLELGAGVGLAAVFAAASNTPLALTVMAMELMGVNVFPHVLIVSGLAYFVTGHRSIYPAQRALTSKPWWR